MKKLKHIKLFERFINEGWFEKLEIPNDEDVEFVNNIAISNFNSSVKSFLGSGVFGWSFELENGKVMKFTTDESEALNAKRLIGKKTRNLINYYNVIRLKSSEKIKFDVGGQYIGYTETGERIKKNKRILKGFDNSYVITMDKVGALPRINKKILNEYWTNHTTFVGYQEELKNKIINSSDDDLKNLCLSELEIEIKKNNDTFKFSSKAQSNKIIDIMFDINKIYQELWINNIITTDIHSENMGILDGKMIAFDFGFNMENDSNLINYDSSYKDEYNSIENFNI